jgi:hypothetical protein
MLFVSYAVFLGALGSLLGRAATRSKEPSVWDRGYGPLTRGVMLTTSLMILVLGLPMALDREHTSTFGNALWASLIVGSALYSVGAASWTGKPAFLLREVGWILMAVAFLIPSTLTLGLPLVALLAFALVPISSIRASDAPNRRSVPA